MLAAFEEVPGLYGTAGRTPEVQRGTLYVPAPVTRAGTNEIVVLTLDAASSATARFVPSALLGPTEE